MDKSKQVSRSYRELIQCSDSCENVSGSRTNYSAWQAAHSKYRSKHNWVWHFRTCALIHTRQMFKGKETWNNVNKFLASIYRKQKWHAAISQKSGQVLQKEALSERMLISPRLGICERIEKNKTSSVYSIHWWNRRGYEDWHQIPNDGVKTSDWADLVQSVFLNFWQSRLTLWEFRDLLGERGSFESCVSPCSALR